MLLFSEIPEIIYSNEPSSFSVITVSEISCPFICNLLICLSSSGVSKIVTFESTATSISVSSDSLTFTVPPSFLLTVTL